MENWFGVEMTLVEETSRSTDHGSALEKSLLVLRHVVMSSRPIGLAEISETVELPKQTIHRILQQLSKAQLILRAPHKDRYVVGPALTQLSVQALGSLNMGAPVFRALTVLAEETGETCNVGLLEKDEIVYIERVEGPSPLRLQLDVGSRVPVHCTAIGKLLMAHQHKNVRSRFLNAHPLEKFTQRTMTDSAELEAEFKRIRSDGYSFNNEEYVEGLTAMGVPIRDTNNKVIAALAVHAPSTRMDHECARGYLPVLESTAKSISESWLPFDEAASTPVTPSTAALA